MPYSSLSCEPLSATLDPLEASRTITDSQCPTPSRPHRPRRVLYPAYQNRRPPLKEAPDHACRWLLLLSALVFLQIYTEDIHTCTELQRQGLVTFHPSEEDASVCAGQEWKEEEPWKVEVVVRGAPEQVME